MLNVAVQELKRVAAQALIKELPREEDLTERELAIHIRAFEAGHLQGELSAKRMIVDKFQLAVIGHVI